MSKHTPGPWTVERPRRAHVIHILHGEPPPPEHEWQQGRRRWDSATNTDILDHRVVSLCWYREDGLPLEEQEANATLIAAAPDLLAALDEIAGMVESMYATPDAMDDPFWQVARAAIAKAGGEA